MMRKKLSSCHPICVCKDSWKETTGKCTGTYLKRKKISTAYLPGHECSIILIVTKEMGSGLEKIVDATTVSEEPLPWQLGMNMIKSVKKNEQLVEIGRCQGFHRYCLKSLSGT